MNLISTDPFSKNRSQFDLYKKLLLQWNQKINLTSITEPEEIDELHFLDSLAILPYLVSRETVLDIGSGAGFPGIPIRIATPHLQVVLVDSVKKKCDFMKTVIRGLHLGGISVVHKRVTPEEPFGQFDLIVSRATFKLPRLIELAVPNMKPNGLIVAQKGPDTAGEIQEAKQLVNRFRLSIKEEMYRLPRTGQVRKIVLMQLT